jgi:hypothetical protein
MSFSGCDKHHVYMNYRTGRKELFCSEECCDNFYDQYCVENYNGAKIYKFSVDGVDYYAPYAECWYGYKTIEECKERMDHPDWVVISRAMFALHNHFIN